MSLNKSLQERIVEEIKSTYSSIAAYKNHTSKNDSNSIIYNNTAKKRVKIIEHKLKTLKMMLAKVDDGDYRKCEKCNQPILINRLVKKPYSTICTKCV